MTLNPEGRFSSLEMVILKEPSPSINPTIQFGCGNVFSFIKAAGQLERNLRFEVRRIKKFVKIETFKILI